MLIHEFIESYISWASGFFVVACVSTMIAFYAARLEDAASRWSIIVIAPIIVSYCLYWSPVWFGANSSEYLTWYSFFIIPWSIVSILLSMVIVFLFRRFTKTKNY